MSGDALFIGYDKSPKDETLLAVIRVVGGETHIVKAFRGEEAENVHRLLTEEGVPWCAIIAEETSRQ